MTVALFAVLLASQQDKTVFRTEKNDYTGPVARCKEAESVIETDPAGAIGRLDEILANARLTKIECRLRIEERPSEYSAYYAFFPYQYRGRARLALARKSDPETAMKLAQGAVQDFQQSVQRGVAASGDFLKTANADLDRLAVLTRPGAEKEDPFARFRGLFDPLVRDHRFRSARDLVEKEGKTLTDDQRRQLLMTADQRCRDFLVTQVASFRPRFISAVTLGLSSMTSDEFDVTFALPAAEELTTSHPAIDWARANLGAFRDVQSGKRPAHALDDAAAAAAALEDKQENPWFRALEGAVAQGFRAAVLVEVEKARDAARADREKARAQADALVKRWKAFTAKLDPKFAERHRFVADHDQQLAKMLDGFPVDLVELDKAAQDLDAAFAAPQPDAELARIERDLESLGGRPNVSRESRRRLFTAHLTASALRGLLAGKSEEAVATELSAWRGRLREVGGAAGADTYGPRVEKVFAALK